MTVVILQGLNYSSYKDSIMVLPYVNLTFLSLVSCLKDKSIFTLRITLFNNIYLKFILNCNFVIFYFYKL